MGCHFCPDAVKAEALDDFFVRVTFADGKVTITDMKPIISKGPAFKRMNNKYFFSLVKADESGCVVWPGELDFAPEGFYQKEE